MDTDSIFLTDFDYPDEDIGFNYKSTKPVARRVMAGTFYYRKNSINFLRYCNSLIFFLFWKSSWWYVDQFCLELSFNNFKNDYTYKFLNNNFMSDFVKDKPVI